MKIDLISLKEGKNHIHLEEDSAALDLPGEIALKTPVRIDGSLLKQGHQYFLKAEILYTLETECSRCLEPFDIPMKVPLEGYYQTGSRNTAQAEPEDEELVDLSDRDKQIDLTPKVRESMMLENPIKPICSKSCQGLCPRCGTNLNLGRCTCKTRPIDSRWAALESLRD